jgi:hypothetical protein
MLTVLLLAAGWAAAQTQTGTVTGKITDQQGGVLPGVTMTLTGPRGTTSAVSDAEGNFRFVGIQPSTYKLKAELSGFLPQEQDVIVGMGKTATVDFGLKVGGVTETVEVMGTSSTVDVKSSATTTNVSGELLSSMAIYDSTSTGLMNNAPGVNNTSAYGGTSSYGNALLMDGVDTRDPEGGSAWTFFNQDLIEEIQIGGLGAPAEYGGFSGGIVNTITKSGGNLYSGLFSIRYTNDKLAGNNVTKAILDKNPALGAADVMKSLTDYSVQLGGPLVKDKAFFFASAQRYSANNDPSGPLKSRTEISPRFNAKITLQPTPNDTIIGAVQYDSYNIHGRVGWWSSDQAIDSATVTEDAPEWVYNAQYRRVFGASALLEAKFTGYTGYYYLDPVDPRPPTLDFNTGEYGGGGGGLYYADRSRNQLNVSLTKYAEKFGHHAFKFGAEYERSHVRSYSQPYGPAGFYIATLDGVPYAQYSYSYDLQGDNRRTSAYAQDQWTLARLTLNLGVRLDHIKGLSAIGSKDPVYTPKAAWGPRVGVAYDVTGKGMTVMKAFWGRYFEGASSGFYYYAAPPGVADYTAAYYDENGQLGPKDVLTPGFIYGISKDMRHPRTDDFNVAFEQQITKDVRFTATGIYRTAGNFINNVIPSARWSPTTVTNGLTGQPFPVYYWDNRSASSTDWYITNIDGFQYKASNGSVLATANPKRDYKALMFVLTRSLKRSWGFQASYVLAKAMGTVDNGSWGSWLGGNTWATPNLGIINNYGELTNSRRHEIKAFVSYQVPRIDVLLGLSYMGYSGRPFTPYQQYSKNDLNTSGAYGTSSRRILLEPRGTERNDFYHNVDLHAEKAIRTMGNRFSVFVNVQNLFNRSGITGVQTRYPSTTIGGETVLYKSPTSVQTARQTQFGARWTF